MGATTKVFSIHRIVAGGFSLFAVLTPTLMAEIFGTKQGLSIVEKLLLQSWGCFIAAFAFIAHSAISFESRAQRAVATAFAGCFGMASCVYSFTLYAWASGIEAYPPSSSYVVGMQVNLLIFGSLFGAYAVALFLDAKEGGVSSTSKRP